MRTCSNAELENFPQLDWLEIASRMQPESRGAIERQNFFDEKLKVAT